MSYMLSLQNMYPSREIFKIIKKRPFFIIVSGISAIATVAIAESEMSRHAGQENKLLR